MFSILFISILAALGLWASVSTVVVTARDGYGPVPARRI